MQLSAVETFIEVMKLGSFAAVARQRDVNPSSISRSIARLESELGFRLFQRTKRKLAPTEAASVYFAQVSNLVDDFARAGQEALDLTTQPRGTLRVTACTSFGERILSPLLPKLFATYPALSIDLVLDDRPVDLVAEQIDLAIRFGSKPVGNVTATMLAPRRFKVCASPDYLRKHGPLRRPEELENRNCILFPLPGYRDHWLYRRGENPPLRVPVRGTLLVSHGVTMTACAVAGMGPALLPYWLCNRELEDGTLIELFPEYEWAANNFETAAWLVHPSRSYVPNKVRAFAEFLQEEVRGFS